MQPVRRVATVVGVGLVVAITMLVAVGCGGGGGRDRDRSAGGGDLTGTWVLDQAASGSPDFGTKVTVDATFTDQRVSGIGGCNRYSADLTTTAGGRFAVGPIATTKMMCTPENQGVEDDYLRRLAAAESYDVSGGELHVVNGAGADLVFHR